jgi:diacylglycerol kinase family enzyme
VAVEADVPLGVLPLGTLNHFARDAGMPLELEAALDVIVEGREAWTWARSMESASSTT